MLGVRSLVISRSTFVGSGRYTGHWLGDNASQWKHMINSIPGLLAFHVFTTELSTPIIIIMQAYCTFRYLGFHW